MYNKYMGGVDCNDQLLQYSAFSKRTIKWWKKVFFRLLNISIVNAYILYQEWDESRKCTQTEFRIEVVKKILAITPEVNQRYVCIENTELGRHFIHKICQEKKLMRSCKVCVAAERARVRLPVPPVSSSSLCRVVF